MAQIGEIIDRKYEILREVGRGGMSVVYLAMDKRLNKQWAIKEFRKDKDDANQQVALKALLDEANLMKKLDHPTLPRIVDIIDVGTTVYIVMDYIEGESLNKVLDAYGAQPQEAVIEWAKQLSEVLDYLHTQNPPVIYRDMKPANIMLKPDGTVRLIDFGIAREYKEGKEGDTEAIGTRGYAAPEQFGGRGQTDARTDIYSLGVTLYHLVTGKNPAEPPYEIYPIRHWDPNLSSGLEWLIQKCTQLNPNDRYQSCAEITYVLENLNKFEGAYKKTQKRRIHLFTAATILFVVFAASSVGSFWGSSQIAANTYQSYCDEDTVTGYVKAIESDPDNPSAYMGLTSKLWDQGTVIHAGERKGKISDTENDGEFYQGEMRKWFDGLKRLEKTNPAEYAQINFDLGLLIWNKYKGESGQQIEAAEVANKYFKAVIRTDAGGLAGKNAGLSAQRYTLAKLYYLTTYFQSKKNSFEREDGAMSVGEEEAIHAGIEGLNKQNKTIDNPWYSYWSTNKKMLQELAGKNGDSIDQYSVSVKLSTLRRFSYVLGEDDTDKKFLRGIKQSGGDPVSEMNDFCQLYKEALQTLYKEANSENNEENQKECEEIAQSFNRVIPKINEDYKMSLEKIKFAD